MKLQQTLLTNQLYAVTHEFSKLAKDVATNFTVKGDDKGKGYTLDK